MRHRYSGRKLGRNSSHRKAMLRNMVTSLFEHGQIITTEARAKELRGVADRLVTLGKRDTPHARRQAARTLRTSWLDITPQGGVRPSILDKLFTEIAPGFKERNGGYTRIVRLGHRKGDNAPMVVIELMPPGAPEGKLGRAPVAPTVATAVVPESKEQFE